MQYLDFNEIKEVYCKLDKSGKFPKNEGKLKYEKDIYDFIYDLYKKKYINEVMYTDLKDKCADALLEEELKGFTSGVYLILKLKSEMGQDFESIIKSFES